MARSAVVILEHGKVAFIRRVRADQTYYLFPGGGIEEAETPEAAAIREAYEELGLVIELDKLLTVVKFGVSEQYYYLAHVVEGVFGTGTGAEMASSAMSEVGSYTPVWIALDELTTYDVRPIELIELLTSQDETDGSH